MDLKVCLLMLLTIVPMQCNVIPTTRCNHQTQHYQENLGAVVYICVPSNAKHIDLIP